MPQLDVVTFFSQVFWLIVVFLVIYYYVATRYIPRLAYILKYRIKTDYMKGRLVQLLDKELEFITRNDLIKKHIKVIRKYSNQLTTTSNAWYTASLHDINQVQLKELNKVAIENQAMYPAYNYLKNYYLNIK